MKPSDRESAPTVRVRGASLRYAGRMLFDGLDLELPPGQVTCLLGPSGVGKSTLLRIIAGLAPEATASVSDGQGRPLAGRIAYMAQQDLLLPWLPALDNVLLGSRLRDEPVTDEVVERGRELLRLVDLAGSEAALPGQLSGGMRQRCALARTLMEERPLVLMDEPFSGLDAITRYDIQAMAARLLEGRSVLLVTHDPAEALRLGHRIHVMAGRPAELDAALVPEGDPPRPAGDPAAAALQAELLVRLTGAKKRMNGDGAS